jgi:hypothetical protein
MACATVPASGATTSNWIPGLRETLDSYLSPDALNALPVPHIPVASKQAKQGNRALMFHCSSQFGHNRIELPMLSWEPRVPILIPMNDVIEKAIGQGSVEIVKLLGKMGLDWWQAHRERSQERLDKLGCRTGNILNIGSVVAEPVPDKIAIPILDAASLEDDETLQEKWAGLLASAADPASRDIVHPSFPEMLKTFSPQEAKFLDACRDEVDKNGRGGTVLGVRLQLKAMYVNMGLTRLKDVALTMGVLNEHPEESRADEREFSVALDHLEALKLLDRNATSNMKDYLEGVLNQFESGRGSRSRFHISQEPRTETTYRLTALGMDFVRACRGPAPRGDGNQLEVVERPSDAGYAA